MGATVLALIASMGPTSPASAHGYGFSGVGVYLPDSADYWYCFYNNLPDVQPYHDAAAYLDARTEMYDVFTAPCSTSTDVMYLRNDNAADPAGNAIRGQAYCVTAVGYICDAYWVLINYVEILANTITHGGDNANAVFNLVKTIRHETGHAAGMWHLVPGTDPNPPACGSDVTDTMAQGWVPTTGGLGDLIYAMYNDHHTCHVNEWV